MQYCFSLTVLLCWILHFLPWVYPKAIIIEKNNLLLKRDLPLKNKKNCENSCLLSVSMSVIFEKKFNNLPLIKCFLPKSNTKISKIYYRNKKLCFSNLNYFLSIFLNIIDNNLSFPLYESKYGKTIRGEIDINLNPLYLLDISA